MFSEDSSDDEHSVYETRDTHMFALHVENQDTAFEAFVHPDEKHSAQETDSILDGGSLAYVPIMDSMEALIDRGTFRIILHKEISKYARYLSANMKPCMLFTLSEIIIVIYRMDTDKKYVALYRNGNYTPQQNISIAKELTLACINILIQCVDYHMQQSCEWKKDIHDFIENIQSIFRNSIWNPIAKHLRTHGIDVPSMDDYISSFLSRLQIPDVEGMFFKALYLQRKNLYICQIFGKETDFFAAEGVDICPSFLRHCVTMFLSTAMCDREKLRTIFQNDRGRQLISWRDYGVHRNMSTPQLITQLFKNNVFLKAIQNISTYYVLSEHENCCAEYICSKLYF